MLLCWRYNPFGSCGGCWVFLWILGIFKFLIPEPSDKLSSSLNLLISITFCCLSLSWLNVISKLDPLHSWMASFVMLILFTCVTLTLVETVFPITECLWFFFLVFLNLILKQVSSLNCQLYLFCLMIYNSRQNIWKYLI